MPLILAIIVMVFGLLGCDLPPTTVDPHQIVKQDGAIQPELGQRFEVTSHGYFHAGYGDNLREVLTLTDKSSGKKYLVVTGCGCTEFHTEMEGKHTVTREE